MSRRMGLRMRVLIFFVLIRFFSSSHLIDDAGEAFLIFSTGVPALAAVELSEGAAARSQQGAPRTPRAPSVVAMVALREVGDRGRKKDKTSESRWSEGKEWRDWRPGKKKKKKLDTQARPLQIFFSLSHSFFVFFFFLYFISSVKNAVKKKGTRRIEARAAEKGPPEKGAPFYWLVFVVGIISWNKKKKASKWEKKRNKNFIQNSHSPTQVSTSADETSGANSASRASASPGVVPIPTADTAAEIEIFSPRGTSSQKRQ